MKKFLIRVLLFLMPLILIAYSADRFISKELKKSHQHAQSEFPVWNDLFDGNVRSDIVVYGSSRAWVEFDPQLISDSLHRNAYNLGIDGHNFWLQYLRHSLLLKYNIKPGWIIQSLDIFTLQKRKDLYNPDQFLPYMFLNDDIKNATSSYEGYDFLDYKIPLIRYYGKEEAITTAVKMFLKPGNNPVMRVKGYQGQNKVWNADFTRAKKTMDYYQVKMDPGTVRLFERYLNECKEKGIKIIFVYAPEYIEAQKFVKNRDELFALYKKFSLQYNIPFYDYSNNAISFRKDLFYNAEHLNKTGAEIFSAKLADTLKKANIFH